MKLTFVDPTMDPRLLDWASSKDISGGCSIYRFYTIYMYGKSLDNLIPSNDCMQVLKKCGFGDSNTIEFDQRYAAELLCDPMKFVDLVTILLSLQRDQETIIISNYLHPYAMPIVESLIKFIQERYSIQSYVVNDCMDINDLKVSEFDTEYGYENFVSDIDRFHTQYPNNGVTTVFDI